MVSVLVVAEAALELVGGQDGGADGAQGADDFGLVGIDVGSGSEQYFGAMKKRFFLGACLVALASQPVLAQTGAPDIVVMQVRESPTGTARVVLAYPGGKLEEQEFKAGYTEKAQNEAASEYQKLFTKLYQQGYVLKSTFGSGNSGVYTVVFVKGQ